VLAGIVLGARNGGGRQYNDISANEPFSGWVSFDGVSSGEAELYAQARVNPLIFKTVAGEPGVVIGDVLSLANDGRYNQWLVRRVDDLIYQTIEDYLNNFVKLSANYLWGNFKTDALTISTAAKVDGDVSRIFASLPPSLLTGPRGTGWEWRFEDIIEGTDGPEPVFLLGTAPAQVGRIFYVKVGRVEGRFSVSAVEAGNELQVAA
jgi:hypothetical protein